MSNKTEWIQQEINNLQTAGLYNRIRTIGSPTRADYEDRYRMAYARSCGPTVRKTTVVSGSPSQK